MTGPAPQRRPVDSRPASSASGRIPLPGPVPAPPARTLEQRAFLGVGAAFLLASALSAAELVWRLVAGRSPVVVAFPLLYLALGWLSLVFGLTLLSGERRAASEARGPWLAAGALVIFLCAPLPASLLYPARERSATFVCERCGLQGHAEGKQNYWGGWLERRLKRLGLAAPAPGQAWPVAPGACRHPGYLPWEE
ncbi:MAG: hypothetical protein AB7N76_02780 [Planctomycetota bacterium]